MSDPFPICTRLDDPRFKEHLTLLDEEDCLLALRLWGITAKDQPTEAEADEMSGGRLAFRDLALTEQIAGEIALWSTCLAFAEADTERGFDDDDLDDHRVHTAAVELYDKRDKVAVLEANALLMQYREIKTTLPPLIIPHRLPADGVKP